MSKELAEAMDLDPISDEKRDEFEEFMKETPSVDISQEEFEERLKAVRNGEFVPTRVNSWEELWSRENNK